MIVQCLSFLRGKLDKLMLIFIPLGDVKWGGSSKFLDFIFYIYSQG